MHKLVDEFESICRREGWRVTPQRLAVYGVFRRPDCAHPTVEQVWHLASEKLPRISLDTVYRILDAFAQAGIVRQIRNADAVRYDHCLHEHHHFFCRKCGGVKDFETAAPPQLREVLQAIGQTDYLEVQAYGLCNACRDSKNA